MTRDSHSLAYHATQADGRRDPEFRLGWSESDIVVAEPWDSNSLS